MACYNEKCSACCGGVIKLISVLICMLGLLVLVFGAMQTDYLPPSTNYVNIDIGKSGFGMAVIFLGLVSIMIAILGCCTAKTKNCLFATMFITTSFLMGLSLLIIGIIMSGFMKDGIFEEVKTKTCAKSVMLTTEYNLAVDKVLCSNQCPCPKGTSGKNQQMWDGYGNDFLRQHSRTVSGESNLTSSEQDLWRQYGDDADIMPLVFTG